MLLRWRTKALVRSRCCSFSLLPSWPGVLVSSSLLAMAGSATASAVQLLHRLPASVTYHSATRLARQSFLGRLPECDSGPLGEMPLGAPRDSSGLCARAAVGASGCGLPNGQRHHPSTCPACICGCRCRLHASCLACSMLDRSHSRPAAVLHMLALPAKASWVDI
ncbi:hypothetical protein HDV57DRAFT_7214 [Trichoderma longibrachiatum]